MTQQSPLQPYRAVLLDIEGTTTPITFVYEVLFPYARQHLGVWLCQHQGSDAWAQVAALLRQDEEACAQAPVPGPEATQEALSAAMEANALWQMDQDRKSTGLKALQGQVWQDGYDSGQLKAEVYPDVPQALRAWQQAGVSVSIYSSGSVKAQRLLFGHTHHGDLLPLLHQYFDTTTGPKREAESYRAIAAALGLEPGEVIFATDVAQEAEAAREAGMQAVIMDRPGNHPQPTHDFAVCATFAPVVEAL